jgi:hypothetical protein
MGAAPGIAGSRRPEVEGVFLCIDPGEADWFVRLNNTGGPVDVWAVEGIELDRLLVSPEGHSYLPDKIGPRQLLLARQDLQHEYSADDHGAGTHRRHDRRRRGSR